MNIPVIAFIGSCNEERSSYDFHNKSDHLISLACYSFILILKYLNQPLLEFSPFSNTSDLEEGSETMKPEFFKIIHANLFTTEQLEIPPDFLKHISKDNSGISVIDGPNTTYSWHVKVCRTEDGTYLTDGWKEFVSDHCLGEHEFLVFRYVGNMYFTVEIYDKTGCKKHFGFSTQMHQELGSSSGGKHRGHPQKKLVEVPRKSRLGPGRPPKDVSLLSRKVIRGRFPGRRMPTEKEKAEVWKAAMTFTSSLPYFIRPLYGSCVYTAYVVNIPVDFARAYLPPHTAEFVFEVHLSGRFWTVKFIPGRGNNFTGGWPAFVFDNQLEAGDICIFELIGKWRMRVFIFRVC